MYFQHITFLHDISGFVFIFSCFIHLLYNRRPLLQYFKTRTGFGIFALAALAIAVPFLPAMPEKVPGTIATIPDVLLPPPNTSSGKPLMAALLERKSQREFSAKPLPNEILGNLFWAANGVNRRESKKRTAPSTRNWREIELYALTAEGVYLFVPEESKLKGIQAGDFRSIAGRDLFVKDAPLVIVYTADRSKAGTVEDDAWSFFSAVDTGFVSQNVYLYCSSEGLATVVLGGIDRKRLAEALQLPSGKSVILSQPVGYSKTGS